MRVRAFGSAQIIKCEIEIRLLPSVIRPGYYSIHWEKNGKLITKGIWPLRDAKTTIEEMFETKLEDWHEEGATVQEARG
jgi:hypothetical protein